MDSLSLFELSTGPVKEEGAKGAALVRARVAAT
jgi:hypothetical protein